MPHCQTNCCVNLFQFRTALLPNSRSTALIKTQTTMTRYKPSHCKSSSVEFRHGSVPFASPGKLSSRQSHLSVPNAEFCSRSTQSQSRDDITSGDSMSECQAGSTLGTLSKPSCSGVVFKASPSRRQVKAVIFERGDDGEPTVTVIMTRESSWLKIANKFMLWICVWLSVCLFVYLHLCLLYILTSICVPCTPKTGLNILFLCFPLVSERF